MMMHYTTPLLRTDVFITTNDMSTMSFMKIHTQFFAAGKSQRRVAAGLPIYVQ
jgi:hypothetical protein